MATGSGGLGDPFIGARRRRRRPTATGDAKETSGFGGKRPIRFDLESTNFQSNLDDDSIREKVEEIPKIVSPQLISPEKERRGRIWKETTTTRHLGSGGGGREEDDGSDRWDPPVSDTSALAWAAAAADWADLGRREREEVLGRLSAQSQKRLLKTFFNLNYS